MQNLTDFKDRLGTRIFGVSIGGDAMGEPLKTICDGRVFPVNKLNSAEDIKDIFQSV